MEIHSTNWTLCVVVQPLAYAFPMKGVPARQTNCRISLVLIATVPAVCSLVHIALTNATQLICLVVVADSSLSANPLQIHDGEPCVCAPVRLLQILVAALQPLVHLKQ